MKNAFWTRIGSPPEMPCCRREPSSANSKTKWTTSDDDDRIDFGRHRCCYSPCWWCSRKWGRLFVWADKKTRWESNNPVWNFLERIRDAPTLQWRELVSWLWQPNPVCWITINTLPCMRIKVRREFKWACIMQPIERKQCRYTRTYHAPFSENFDNFKHPVVSSR